MSTYHYVQNEGKLMMQSGENGQKPQVGQFFDDFEVKYPNLVLTSGQKPKKSLEPFCRNDRNIEVSDFGLIWRHISQISRNQEFFSKIWLCHFSNFIVP